MLCVPIWWGVALHGQSGTVNTSIKGSIRLPDTITLAIGVYQNMHVEYDPRPIYTWSNTAGDEYGFEFHLEKPVMLEFYVTDAHRYRFYITPGSKNFVNIDGDAFTYVGGTSQENALLRRLGFHRTALRSPAYTDRQDLARSLDELALACDALDRQLDTTSFSEDFKRYVRCELTGYRYFWKSNLLHQFRTDTLGFDTLPPAIANESRSLLNFAIVDEVRSRYYLNAVSSYFESLVKLSLSPSQSANYALHTTARFNAIRDTFDRFPDLLNVFMVSAVTTSVFMARTREDLEMADYYLTYVEARVNRQENAFEVIRKELDQKWTRLGISTLDDYHLLNGDESMAKLSDVLEEEVNVLSIWASWCKPCIEKFPALTTLTADQGVNLVHVCIWSTRPAWSKLFEQAAVSPQRYLFADKALSDQIADQCAVTQFPVYVIVDKGLNVLAVKDSYSGLADWLEAN